MATLTVGTHQQYATIAAAVAAARNGDTVSVLAGTYTNDLATIRTNITLVANGGQVVLNSTALASGGALLTVAANAVVDGFVFAGAHAADGTAAGLLQTAGALTVRRSLFTGNQTGLLSTAGSTATVSVQASEFAGNGTGSAFSANVAVSGIQSLSITDSYVHDAAGGDEVRSLAHATTILNSRIEDNAAIAATVLNLANGGTVSVRNSVLEKGARSSAAAVVRFGGGTPYAGSSLSITGNTLVSDKPGAVLVQNTAPAAATVSGNQLWGFTGASVNTGLAVMSGNTVAAARPAVPTAPLITYTTGTPTQYGRVGAVVADGTVLRVGVGGAYATLAAALAVAHDGDTVAVAAGTYAVAPVTLTHKLIIEGVGGIASFTATAATATALFTTAVDVTFRNVEISGAGAAGGPEAAISATGGALTVVNSTIHDNGNGITATGAATTLGIYDTELARNGMPNGFGANVAAAAIDTLTLSNDYVHDALAGPEVSSAAAYTVIDGTRISQAAGNGAADLLLPAGGQVVVTNSALEKGAGAQAVPLVQVGGGVVAPGSTVAITGTTLISDLGTAPTVFVSGNTAAATTLTGDTFVGGAAGSAQAVNATVSGAVVATGVSVGTASPWTHGVSAVGTAVAPLTALTVPVSTAVAAQRGVLVLDVSGTDYHGGAQFQVFVDGAAVGGTLTASASHAAGQSQKFTIGGTFASGPHAVAVKFVNALSGADGTGARSLSLDGAQFNGVPIGQAVTLTANGSAVLSTDTVAAVATPVTVSLSEDAWHGDAQALITIDGKVQDGVQVVTVSHALGGTEPMRFLPMLTPGTHTLGVTFLNDASSPAGDRNLYIDAVDVAGQHIGAAASLLTGGTSSYAFTVAAPPTTQNANLFVTAGTPQAASMIVPAH